jgi:SAM-dependent methyltransferase
MTKPDPIIHDLEIMSRSTNYRDWIYGQLNAYIGERVLEIGAGIGTFTVLLKDKELVIPVDNYPPAVMYLSKLFADHNNITPVEMDISGLQLRDFREYALDTCICFNVLEHIDDDAAVLSSIFEILNQGGHLTLLVPAFMSLFGTIDQLVGHRRRYSKKELESKLNKAGFNTLKLYYMNSIAVPGWFLNNRVLRLQKESIYQVLFFDRFIVPWLKIFERIFPPPFGLSLIAICKK